MKISIFAVGSRGDVQPPAALADALARRGHKVQLIAPKEFAALTEGRGIEFCGLGGDIHEMIRDVASRGKNPVSFATSIVGDLNMLSAQWVSQARDYAADTDFFVGVGGGGLCVPSLGDAMKKPYAIAFLQPILPTAEFPSPALPPFNLPGFANKAEHAIVLQLLWQFFRPLGNKVRKDVLGLGPVPFDPGKILYRDGYPVLIAVSPSVFPQPPEWAGRGQMTGYWFLDATKDYKPPADLATFLAAGPPPVYFGFGSMVLDHPNETVEAILKSVKQAGCRAVISAGWAHLMPEHVTPDIYAGDNLPHDWLLPRMAAVCHHGGAGTAAAAMRAGKPNIVVPFFADQPFFGWWLEKIGIAPHRIPQKQLSVDTLSYALDRTLNDTAMRAKAERLGEKIRAEDGAGRAAELIETMPTR